MAPPPAPAERPSPAAPVRTGALPVATYALGVAQLVAWVVVRRYLLPGNAWTDFALRPGTPSEIALLISPFIHLDPPHLGVNLAVLWLFGTNLERAIGSLRFLFLYLGAAWFASLMQWAVFTSFHLHADLGASNAAVGSSGAIAGVLGASFVRFPQARLRIPLLAFATFPTAPIIVLWVVYTVVRALVTTITGLTEGVGHWAHFAGFIFGLGMAQLVGWPRLAREEYLAEQAQRAAAREDVAGAARAWSALLTMRPQDREIRTALMVARLKLGDVPGARRLARDGIVMLVRAHEREAALAAFREYARMVPDLSLPPGIRYRIGCWLADAGAPELAFRALWESVREDGASPEAAAALYRAGQLAWERLRDAPQARSAWERLLEQFPDSPWSDAARDGLRRMPG